MLHSLLCVLILGTSMVDIAAVVNPASIAMLKRAINATQAETGRSIHESVKYAAIQFAASGRRRAKPGKKRHSIVRNPEYQRLLGLEGDVPRSGAVKRGLRAQRKKQFAWAIQRYHQDKPPTYEPVPGKNRSRAAFLGSGGVGARPTYRDFPSSKTKIVHRGAAKMSWGWMLRKMGRSGKAGIQGVSRDAFRLSRKHVYAKLTKAGVHSKAELGNYLVYMRRAFPGIADEAMKAASRGLFYQVDKAIHRRVVRKLWA
jgi:hypothetical protein